MAEGIKVKVGLVGPSKAEIAKAEKVIKDFKNKAEKGDIEAKYKLNISDLQIQIRKVKEELKRARKIGNKELEFEASLRLQGLNKDLRTAKRSLKDFTGETSGYFKKMGETISRTIKNFVAFTAVAVGIRAAGKAIKGIFDTFVSFESAFAGVKKTLDGTTGQFERLEQGLLKLARTMPITFEELSKIAEVGGQLGIGINDIEKFTEVIAKIGTATNLSADAAATAFARILNVTGESFDNIEKFGSVLVELGNNSATTESEILEFANRIKGIGKVVGLGTTELLAIGTAFTSVGVTAEAGGTAVQKAMIDINKAVLSGGEQLEKYAKISGMTAEEFKNTWSTDAIQAFDDFIVGLSKGGAETQLILENLGLADARLQRTFLSVAGAGGQLTESMKLANNEFKNGTALIDEFAKRAETTASKMTIFGNQMKEAFVGVGEYIADSLLYSIDLLDKGLIKIGIRSEEVKDATDELTDSQKRLLGNVEKEVEVLEKLLKKREQITKDTENFIHSKKEERKLLGEVNDEIAIQQQRLDNASLAYNRNTGDIEKLSQAEQELINKIEAKRKAQDLLKPYSSQEDRKEYTKLQNEIDNTWVKINDLRLKTEQSNKVGIDTTQSRKELLVLNSTLKKTAINMKEFEKFKAALKRGDKISFNIDTTESKLDIIKDTNKAIGGTIDKTSQLIKLEEKRFKESLDRLKELDMGEEQRAKTILALEGSLQARIKRIRGDSHQTEVDNAKDYLKLLKEKKDTENKTYDEIGKKIKGTADNIKKYADNIGKIKDKISELKDSASKDIRELNGEIADLNLEISGEKADIGLQLAQRESEILEEQRNIKQDLKDLAEEEGNTYQQKLEFLAKQKQLEEELKLIKASSFQEEIKAGKELEARSETEKILDTGKQNISEIEQLKKIAEERVKINEAIKDGNEIKIEETDEGLKGYIQLGDKIIEIQELKNLEYAKDQEQKITAFNDELNRQQTLLDQELVMGEQLLAERKRFLEEYDKRFGESAKFQISELNKIRKAALAAAAAMKSAGVSRSSSKSSSSGSSSSRSTTNNSTRNVTINQNISSNVDMESGLRELNSRL